MSFIWLKYSREMLEGFLNFLSERQAIGALNIFHDQRVQKETNFLECWIANSPFNDLHRWRNRFVIVIDSHETCSGNEKNLVPLTFQSSMKSGDSSSGYWEFDAHRKKKDSYAQWKMSVTMTAFYLWIGFRSSTDTKSSPFGHFN